MVAHSVRVFQDTRVKFLTALGTLEFNTALKTTLGSATVIAHHHEFTPFIVRVLIPRRVETLE